MKTTDINNLDFFSENYTLLSSKFNRLEFKIENERLVLTLSFILVYPRDKHISLEFREFENYSFFVSGENYFYNVESFKFFKKDDLFYISLDPYDESNEISENDNDFILARNLTLIEHK